jgi:hypothetical protein
LKQFTTTDGLVNDSIWGIQEDIDGNIYIETQKGISKLYLQPAKFSYHLPYPPAARGGKQKNTHIKCPRTAPHPAQMIIGHTM